MTDLHDELVDVVVGFTLDPEWSSEIVTGVLTALGKSTVAREMLLKVARDKAEFLNDAYSPDPYVDAILATLAKGKHDNN